MNYLVVNNDCVLNLDKPTCIKANVPYQLTDLQNEYVLCVCKNQTCVYANFYALFLGIDTNNNFFAGKNCVCNSKFCTSENKYVGFLAEENVAQSQLVCCGENKYLFLFFVAKCKQDFRCFEFDNKQIFILMGESLIVNYDGKQVVKKCVGEVEFSHFETEGDFCCMFFAGKRKFVVVLSKTDLVWADFYDEYNASKGEKQILKHMSDGLNHGMVLNLKDDKSETYLVYLDDYELQLKPKFVALIFMDCLLAGNYKYCATLVDKSLRFDEKNIKQFLPDFDAYYPLTPTCFVMFKKNALVGICDFEVVDDKIVNIKIE